MQMLPAQIIKFLTVVSMLAVFAVLPAGADDLVWEGSVPGKPQPKVIEQKGIQFEKPAPTTEMSPLEIERQQKMLRILRKPVVPLKANDKIIRILMLPYVDDNNVLHNYKYVYTKVEDGKWVLGDYLLEPTRIDRKILKPIENPTKGSAVAPDTKGNRPQPAEHPRQVKKAKEESSVLEEGGMTTIEEIQ